MSDIVERLRWRAENTSRPEATTPQLCAEAAAEIESLRQKTQYWPDNAERDAVIRHQKEEIERLRAALREAASDLQMSLQIDKQKDAKIEQLTTALQGVVDDEPCWLDHHGYCQTHGLGKPCEMSLARAALEHD